MRRGMAIPGMLIILEAQIVATPYEGELLQDLGQRFVLVNNLYVTLLDSKHQRDFTCT